MSKQPEALRLADAIDYPDVSFGIEAAAELRRLHAVEKRYEAIKRMRWSDLQAIKQQPPYGFDFDAHIDAAIAKAQGESNE